MRVAIANRGEVAVRIIRTCQELGYTTILLHSTPDHNTVAFRLADETIELPGNTPTETYLNITVVVEACKKAKADLVHPGFGFLSENGDFVASLETAKLNFVGPSAKSIFLAGNKIKAKELAKKAGVPTVPSFTGSEKSVEKILSEVQKIGFPCIIKAAAGGGGKGMKVTRSEKDFFELYDSAKREALNAFGSDQVFIEKYIERPQHIEVQILFDKKGTGLHLGERECSIQRRHQKIFEETPSANLPPALRSQITQAALKIGEAAGYTNAGTVEFLVDDGKFYFMELNTRLQVEHTVTEEVLGLDLVKLQFEVAQGKALGITQSDLVSRGHALEIRLYAENPAQEFLPSTGKIALLNIPHGPHRRFDFGYGVGDEITPFYDPMIGKVITWAPTRDENIQRMMATLSELIIFGVYTNIEFLKDVLNRERFKSGRLTTKFLDDEYPEGFNLKALTAAEEQFIKVARSQARSASIRTTSTQNKETMSPWTSGSFKS